MIKEAIIKVAKKEDLTYEEAKAVMNEIMDGETSQVQTEMCIRDRDCRGSAKNAAMGAGSRPDGGWCL